MHRGCTGFLHLISDLEFVKLPEDITLAGFTPLMLNPQDPSYVEKTEDMVIYIVCYVFGNCADIHICEIRAFIAGNKLQASLKQRASYLEILPSPRRTFSIP